MSTGQSTRKRKGRAVALAGFSLIFLPIVSLGFGKRAANLENRTLARPPGFSDGWTIPSQLGKYISDRIPWRSTAIRVDSWVDSNVFREDPAFGGSASPRVIAGEGGYLFLADALDNACSPHLDPRATATRFAEITKTIASTGRSVVAFVAPDKSTVHPDYLPRGLPKMGCFEAYTETLWSSLSTSGAIGYIDMRKLLTSSAKRTRAGLYLRKDSHWDNQGSLLAVREIIKSIDESLWQEDEIVEDGFQGYVGDLTGLRGVPEDDKAPRITVSRPGVTETQNTQLEGSESGENRRIVNITSGRKLIPGRTLMFYDSFGIAALPQLKPFFEDLTVIRIMDFEQELFAQMIESSDRVIIQSVERSLGYRMAMEFGNTNFQRYLVQQLTKKS
jgi:alginate O-acetyltransferase complex protein AlgJ